MKRRTFLAGSAAVATMASGTLAWANPTRLLLPSLHSETSGNTLYFQDWAQRVNAASGGALEVEVRSGTTIANFGNILERIQSNIVHIGVMTPNLIGGRFPQASIITLPGVRGELDGGKASIAAWELFETGLLDQEMAGLKVLAFSLHPEAGLHFSHRLERESFADLRGLKIGVQGGVQAQLLRNLGATPLSLTPAEWYEGLQRGTVDGVVSSWAGFPPLNLGEVTQMHIEGPFGNGSQLIAMDQSKWDELPPEAQAAIDAHSGAAFSESWGMYNHRQAITGRDAALAQGNDVRQLTAEERAAWLAAAEPIIGEWVAATANGPALLDAFRDRVAAQ